MVTVLALSDDMEVVVVFSDVVVATVILSEATEIVAIFLVVMEDVRYFQRLQKLL